MDRAASLMNDTAQTVYTYAAQLPYLSMALDEMQEYFEMNNIPVTNETSTVIDLDIGETAIRPADGFGAGASPPNPPNYPENLVEIQGVYERLQGSSEPWIPVTQREFLPHLFDDQPTTYLGWWVFESQQIRFIGATTDREVKLDYIQKLFPDVIDEDSELGVINVKTFLYYRTASLCCEFIGENPTRAAQLNMYAVASIERSTSISIKGKQGIMTRRRPFRAAYRNGGW